MDPSACLEGTNPKEYEKLPQSPRKALKSDYASNTHSRSGGRLKNPDDEDLKNSVTGEYTNPNLDRKSVV